MLLELGGFFTAALAVEHGRIVDGIGGSAGGLGYRALGTLDGEVAYALGRVRKSTLFTGGAAFVAGVPDLPPEELAARAAHDARARVAWDALIEAAAKLVAALRVAAPGAREVLLSGRVGRVPAVAEALGRRLGGGAARAIHRRLRHARQGSGAGRGADRRRPRRREAPATSSRRCASARAAARCSTTSTWRAPTRCGATSGSRADPDRRSHDPRPRRVSRARRGGDRHRRLLRRPRSGAPLRDASVAGARARILGRRDPRGGARPLVRRRRVLRRPGEPSGRGRRARPRSGAARQRARHASPGARSPRALPVPRGPRVRGARYAPRDRSPPRRRPVAPQAGAGGRRAGRARLGGPAACADPDPPGARRGRERVGLVRGRRPPERGPRLDRAAPRPAELPVRGQHHAARGRGGGARRRWRRSRTP